MTSRLFTIGFTKKTAEEFFRLLQEAEVRRVIDVRENRVGQLAGFAKYPDIAFFLERILRIEYRHEPVFAPTPEIRIAYRKTGDWEQYEKAFSELMANRKVLEDVEPARFEGRVALLCSEAGPERCHRRLVAEMLAAHWNALGHEVHVQHLVMDRPVTRRKRKAKRHDRIDPL